MGSGEKEKGTECALLGKSEKIGLSVIGNMQGKDGENLGGAKPLKEGKA